MTQRLVSYVGWTIVLSASLYFIYNNALHYLSYNKDDYQFGFWPTYAPFLFLHVAGGLIALVLGPFQFIASFRKKYPFVHRTMGKIYLSSILLAGLASLFLSVGKVIITEKSYVFGFGLSGLGIAWLLTSSMAYWAVRSKNFVQHREWMVKSFVVTCGFTSFRLLDKLMIEKFNIDYKVAGDLMAWACWAVPLLITEVILQANKISRGNKAMAHHSKR